MTLYASAAACALSLSDEVFSGDFAIRDIKMSAATSAFDFLLVLMFMMPSMRAVWCGNSTVSHGRRFFLRPDMFGPPPGGQREGM